MTRARRLVLGIAIGALAALAAIVIVTSRGAAAASPVCARLEAQIRACDANLLADAYRSLDEYCEGAVAYTPAPGDSPANLAALAKVALETCSAKPTCGETLRCLDEEGCRFFLLAPDDPSPIFECH